MTKKFVIVAGVVVALLGAAILGLQWLIPGERVRQHFAELAMRETGRPLDVAGGVSISLLPSLTVTLKQVRLGNPPGMAGEPLMAADAVRAQIVPGSLLSRRLAFRSVTLERPRITLQVDDSGRTNWDLSGKAAKRRRAARADRSATDRAGVAAVPAGRQAPARPPRPLPVELLRIVDGSVSYGHAGGSARQDISALDLSLVPSPGAIAASGSLVVGGIGRIALHGEVQVQDGAASVTGAEIAVGGMTGRGDLAVRFAGQRPHVKGALAFDHLDIDALMGRRRDRAMLPGGVVRAGFLPLPVRVVQRMPPPGEEQRIPVAVLGGIEADIALTAERLTLGDLAAEDGSLEVAVHDSRLRASIRRLGLYGGGAQGSVVVDGRRQPAVLSASLTFEGVAALPLLRDAAAFDWLSGTGSGAISLAGGGETRAALYASLTGEARLSLADGTIEGIDLPAMVRDAERGRLHGWTRKPGRSTAFDRLQATFAITGGVAETTDLTLAGPNVGMTGTGRVHLPRERLDFRLRPQVSARQDDGADAAVVDIPLVVKGPWRKPDIYPDIEKVLDDPDSALESAKSWGKSVESLTGGRVRSEEFGRALDAIFGKKKEKKDR